MVVGRYQVLSVLQLRHETLDSKVHGTDEMLLAIYELYQISLAQAVGVLLD